MSNRFEIGSFYLISGISTESGYKKGKRVYLAYDQSSGGYPWWTDSIRGAEHFSADRIVNSFVAESKASSYMPKQAESMQILRIDMVAETKQTEDFDEIRRQAALAKLTKEEQELLGLEV